MVLVIYFRLLLSIHFLGPINLHSGVYYKEIVQDIDKVFVYGSLTCDKKKWQTDRWTKNTKHSVIED
jgi:hypothetical protein